MAKDQQRYLPSGQGGLMRFSEGYKSKYQISPRHVIIIAFAVILIELALHALN